MKNFDLGIRCDYLLTAEDLGQSDTVKRDWFVGISGAKIVVVEPWSAQDKNSKEFWNAKNKAVMPGLINGHTHLAMSPLKGLADDLPFHEWLNDYILPIEGKYVDAAFVKTGTELAVAESIRFGTTTVCDMYYFTDQVAEVCDRLGVRAVVGQAMMDLPTPDKRDDANLPEKLLKNLYEKYGGHERITPAIAPHAPYTCSDELLQHIVKLSKTYDLPICIHVCETKRENEDSQKLYGKTPVQRLYDVGVLQQSPIMAHVIHVESRDIELIHKTGASVVHNPQSNMKLGAGVAPIRRFLDQKVKVGLGTDGSVSNNNLNLFEEMDTAAKLQKLSLGDNAAITARQILNMATLGGAKALGLEDVTGSLEVGKFADLVVLDLHQPHLQPVNDLISHIVYSCTGMEVETVLCHGRILYQNGLHTTLDLESVYKDIDVLVKKIGLKT